MSWNPALTIITVYGTIQLTDDVSKPASGYIEWKTDYPLTDAVGNIVSGTINRKATLDPSGAFSIELPATNDPDISPINFPYHVAVKTTAYNEEFDAYLPYNTPGGTIAWTMITPVLNPPAPAGTYAPYSEVAARIAADAVLQAEIDTEATNRTNADVTLQTNINNEATTRADADTTLQTNINTEATTRANADTVLTGDVSTLSTGVSTLDAAVQVLGGRVLSIEDGSAFLAGLQVAGGNATISNGILTVQDFVSGFSQNINSSTGVATLGGKNNLLTIELCGEITYSGPPVTGTWAVGNTIIDSGGAWWVCTVAGTPGTWVTGTVNLVGIQTVAGAKTWSALATFSAGAALNAQKITGLADGTVATDAAAFGQIIPVATVDAKGDLIVGTGSDTVTRKAAGTDGLVLTAASAQADGLVWAQKTPTVSEYVASQSGVTTPTGILGAWVSLIGGGGGGGSGRRGAAGTVRCGGGGGGGGGIHSNVWVPAAAFGATYSISVGAGVGGGAARTSDDQDGANAAGGPSTTTLTTGSLTLTTPGAATAGGGTNAAGTAGGGGFPAGGSGGAASATGGTGNVAGGINGTLIGTGGAGSGGGITSGNSPSNGGAGVGVSYLSLGGGAAGVVGGASPGTGSQTGVGFPASGAGGGAASITGVAQNGGTALNYGAGGGGGGASLNGNNSGAGGAGGPGFARVTFIYS